jgi:hypothetical protein
MKITEDFLQKAASCGMAQNLLDALKIGTTIKKPAHEWMVKAVSTGNDEHDRLA